jgi:aryl-alcohol dehydrogenase-like predicted oxidoreductase
MQYRQLGNSDLTVSTVALGSWLTYSGGVEKSQSIACVKRALERGITLIDTANIYGKGAAETVLGEALAGVDRASYVLATKLYFPMTDTDKGLSRGQIEKQLDASLQRLRVDHVDLYQCHRYDAETPLQETMEALTAAVKSGKTRYIGFSEWPIEHVRAATEMMGVEHFVSSQPQYSMIWRKPEADIIPYCAEHGISQIVWSPLGQGILTGKYHPGAKPPAGSRATSATMGHFLQDLTERRAVLEAVQAMQPLAEQAGLSLAQFALAWVLREPNIAAAIIGASHPDQIDENIKAADAKVDPALFTQAEALLAPAMAGA